MGLNHDYLNASQGKTIILHCDAFRYSFLLYLIYSFYSWHVLF